MTNNKIDYNPYDNPDENNKQSKTKKTLTVLGILVLVILTVWLAVQIVGLLPQTFSFLSSLITGSQREVDDLNFTIEPEVVSVDEEISLSWSTTSTPGTFEISYDCVENLSLSASLANAQYDHLPCQITKPIPTNVGSLTMIVTSHPNATTSTSITLAFLPEDIEKSIITTTKELVLILPAEESEVEVTTPEITEPEVTDDEISTDVTDDTVSHVTPSSTIPVLIIPTSDPDGYIDLSARFIDVGHVTNGQYNRVSHFSQNQKGSFRFEVRNQGTKTSGNWSYEVLLPSGHKYSSGTQLPLRPNERSVITISSPVTTDKGIKPFEVKIIADGDVNPANNQFLWAVEVR